MRLAIVCDWLTVFGGAEHVIEEFHSLWPEAPLFTTIARKNALGPLSQAPIRTTPLQRAYRIWRRHQLLLIAMPRAIEDIDLRGFDVILSSSHAVAKGVIPSSRTLHICYCHTPMRYAWEMEEEYLRDFRVPKMFHAFLKRKLRDLRRWDLQTAKRVDVFIANSRETQDRIRRTYARESCVLHPPVHEMFFESPLFHGSRERFLAVGRLVPYKRMDLLIDAANTLHLPLDIAGTGQEEKRLRGKAGPSIRFLGRVTDPDLSALYAHAKALLFPAYEDAGIVPLEAQASGTPVIALGRGGALDTIESGETGIFFEEQSRESLVGALRALEERRFDPDKIRAHARKFSQENFRKVIMRIVEEEYDRFSFKRSAHVAAVKI